MEANIAQPEATAATVIAAEEGSEAPPTVTVKLTTADQHITANSELSARLSDEQERATQLEGALAKIQGEHLEVTVADLRQQLIIAKIQGEHLGVTVANLRQQLITVTAVAEQAAAQVAAKDASLVEVSKLANKHILPRFCPRCATPVQNNLEIREIN